ncbi:MAG TPA: uL15 family ribosomal protein [Thermoplasmata archaeon]|nr:uL15 family ribosomal protein [Thermoplasmata archaeon]
MPSRTRKFRGLRTHGRGIKAGRGAGKQGGRGNAGLHKYKFKSMLIYAPDHFGRHGFKRPPEIVAQPTSLNVGELESFVPALEAASALSREGETFVADLAKAGVDRLLGGGAPVRKWKVFVRHASEHAREKVTVLESPPGEATLAPSDSVP